MKREMTEEEIAAAKERAEISLKLRNDLRKLFEESQEQASKDEKLFWQERGVDVSYKPEEPVDVSARKMFFVFVKRAFVDKFCDYVVAKDHESIIKKLVDDIDILEDVSKTSVMYFTTLREMMEGRKNIVKDILLESKEIKEKFYKELKLEVEDSVKPDDDGVTV